MRNRTSEYLLIESRDPFESADVASFYDLAYGLAAEGSAVTLFLVQNGVLPARAGARAERLAALAMGRVEVLADAFSLRERGIGTSRLAAGVQAAPLDVVIELLADGRKVLWH